MTQDYKTPDITAVRKLAMTIEALLYNQQMLEQVAEEYPSADLKEKALVLNAIGQIKAARGLLKRVDLDYLAVLGTDAQG